MAAEIQIELFGGPAVRRGDRPAGRFPTRKTASLLVYLAFHLRREHPREVLVELFWPNTELEAGRKSLSVALSALRQLLEPDEQDRGSVVLADRLTARLNPAAVQVDVHLFEELLEAAAGAPGEAERRAVLVRAVGLRGGELLPGLNDAWIPRENERLTGRLLAALDELAGISERGGRPDEALEYTRRALAADPIREASHRQVMHLLVSAGRPAEALRQYQELEQTLRRELSAVPSAATRALAASLRSDGSAAAPAPFTRPAPGRAAVARLPTPWSAFFGRREELDWLQGVLAPGGARLVTLTGAGGTGKTRLALEAARRLADTHPGVISFVSVAELDDPDLLPAATARVVGHPGSNEADALERVVEAMSGQPSLLVLDNFEQLLPAGAQFVRTLLDRAPGLTCLVTARQRLAVEGERELAVPPLPAPAQDHSLEELLANESIQLFADRAQAVRPDFRLSLQNAGAVAALCAGLEGVPLALELAAARARVLTPAQMLEQLQVRRELLLSRPQEQQARHRSLEAAIEWSYRLLSPGLQAFFTRLSVFLGGWTLPAAEAICEAPDALDLLSQLQECSLVLAEEQDGAMRYRMLEMLRTYAAARLSLPERAALQRRHRDWFLARSEAAEGYPMHPQPGQLSRREFLGPEHANLWAAIDWCRTHPEEAETGLRIAGTLGWYLGGRGEVARAREALLDLLGRPGIQRYTPWRAKALNAAGVMLHLEDDDVRALQRFEEAVEVSREARCLPALTHALAAVGQFRNQAGDHERARAMFEEALALKRASGDPLGVAPVLAGLGTMARENGDFATARARYEEALTFAREHADHACTAMALDNLGIVALAAGEASRARALCEEALAIRRQIDARMGVCTSLQSLARVAIVQGEPDAAERLLRERLAVQRELGLRRRIVEALISLADLLAVSRGEREEGRGEREEAVGTSEGGSRSEATALYLEAVGLEPKPQASRPALAGLARLAAADGELDLALRLLAAADQPDAALMDRARAALGTEFDRIWAESRTASHEELLAVARRHFQVAAGAYR